VAGGSGPAVVSGWGEPAYLRQGRAARRAGRTDYLLALR